MTRTVDDIRSLDKAFSHAVERFNRVSIEPEDREKLEVFLDISGVKALQRVL